MKRQLPTSRHSSASTERPTLFEWVQALEAQGDDALRLAPHHVQILEFLEDFVASDPPRRLIIGALPSRFPLRGRIE